VAPIKAGQSGRGFDAHHVYIGFNTINNLHTFAEASGTHNLDFGDMKADAEAVIAEVNAHGGVLGRTVVGVYHDEDVSEATTNPAANAQRTCTAFTQDAHVFAAVVNDTAGDDNDNFYRCMAKADTPFLTSADWIQDTKRLRQYKGYLYSMQGPDWDLFAPTFIQRLNAEKYFSPWNATAGTPGSAPAKLGLLFPDTDVGRRVSSVVERLAAAQGVQVVTYLFADGTTQGVAAWESSIQSAVLQFSGKGVTHVLSDASSVTVFATAAENQHYRPRYAIQTLNELESASATAPAVQFKGALGVGWGPVQETGKYEGEAPATCMRAMAKRGLNYAGNGQATTVALITCDDVRLIAAALNAAGAVSTSALAVGLGKIGPTFAPASTFRAGFSPSRADFIGAVRDLGFDSSCTCFRYLASRLWQVS
jgi:ABC-type branched-subunit amino acid transport system substrate-binding protein